MNRARFISLRIGLVSLSILGFASLAAAQPMALPRAPHGFHEEGPPEDSALPDPSLPDRSLVVRVVDGSEKPRAGIEIELLESYENIAEGGKKSKKSAFTDDRGEVRFERLDPSLRYTYSLSTTYKGARYELPSVRLPEKGGISALIHTYEPTDSERDAFVGMRGFIYIAQREDQFVFDVLYRVVTMSRMTWLPKVEISLPKGKKAFDGAKSSLETGFFETERGARLGGSFPPGQKDARFSIQIDRTNQSAQSFEFDVPPHVAELRVIAETTPGMTLSVPGFEPTQETTGPDGKKIVITRRLLRPGEPDTHRHITVRLAGLPEKNPLRYWVSGLALAIVGLGAYVSGRVRSKRSEEQTARKERARTRLLEELSLLEREHQKGEIGPETFGEAKKQLLLAIARLLPSRSETPSQAVEK